MMALVFGVKAALMVSALMFWLFKSTSANTGFAPAVTMQEAEARKVREATMTSSPAPMPMAFSATSSASVPLERATAYCVPAKAANSFSNSFAEYCI